MRVYRRCENGTNTLTELQRTEETRHNKIVGRDFQEKLEGIAGINKLCANKN